VCVVWGGGGVGGGGGGGGGRRAPGRQSMRDGLISVTLYGIQRSGVGTAGPRRVRVRFYVGDRVGGSEGTHGF